MSEEAGLRTSLTADVHTEYQAEQIERAVRPTRFAGVAAIVAILLFSILDLIVYPQYRSVLLIIRFAVVATSLVVLWVTFLPLGRRYAREFGVVLYNVTALSIVVMVHLTEGYRSPYYAGINIVLIVFIAILPLDWVRTFATCLIVYSAYIVPILIVGGINDVAIFFNNNAFLLATISLVILSAWAAERLRFDEFVARRNLALANKELKELDILKSQFFANISHEVRTPLTSVIAPVQSLYHGDAGTLSDLQRDLITQVYRNSIRLLDMINQMLDVAKFDARKMQLNLTVVDLEEVVGEIATVFREVAKQKELKLQYLAEDTVPPIYLDRDKTDRILSNLIRNAIKFTERGSIIIRLRKTNEEIVLEVEDTGIGIPDDQLPTIFDRFRQVDGSSTRRYEGTGLGLTIVKEAIELQHGTIDVVSETDVGTRFTVTFPLDLEDRATDAFIDRRRTERRRNQKTYAGPNRRKTGRRRYDLAGVSFEDLAFVDSKRFENPFSSEEEIGARAERTGYRVVYVEDNQDLRAYVRRMLTNLGHDVVVAVDGCEGWDVVRAVRPDVIVSDVMMPNMDGYELLAALRASEDTSRIPFVLTTAKSEVDEKIRGLERGADEYLAKPINIRELDARIRNLVTTRLLIDASVRARELEKRMSELTKGFADALELRDQYTANHSNDVLTYGSIIAEELSHPVDAILRDSLLLHDIGKLGIPDSVLLKEGPLTDEEWVVMKQHAEMGAQLLSRFGSFQEIGRIIYAHQERYDGSGYPKGLSGEEIPIVARIIAVADAWHAMIEDRPYRRAFTMERAVAELQRGRGTHFDPEVVDAFLRGMVKRGLVPEDIITTTG